VPLIFMGLVAFVLISLYLPIFTLGAGGVEVVRRLAGNEVIDQLWRKRSPSS
jgi:hypothetical protein